MSAIQSSASLPRKLRRIALANQKGGPGKTTISVHVVIALVRRGFRILFIDLDAQGNGTQYFGLERSKTALVQFLKGEQPLASVVLKSKFGVDVVPGGADLDLQLLSQMGPSASMLLKARLDKQLPADSYDFIFFDCPPNLSTATASALLASDEVLIPVDGGMALTGLNDLYSNIAQIKAINEELTVLGLIQNKAASKEVATRQIASVLQQAYGELLFTTAVPRNAAFEQAYLNFTPLQLMPKKQSGTKQSKETIAAFESLADELIARGASL